MATTKRQQDTALRQRLFREFYRFPLIQAVQLLERFYPNKKPLNSTLVPGEEVVRFSVKPALTFPPSDISGLAHPDPQKPVSMEVAFMGLIGPASVLPHTFNELALERLHNKDGSLVAFLNLFHHRLISLFYLAWKKYKTALVYQPDGRDPVSSCFLNLAGLGTPGLLEKMGLPDESIIHYCCGYFARTVPSVAAIQSAVSYFTGEAVHVDQFIERLVPLGEAEQSRLGVANGELGKTAMCGSFIWESQTKFRVNIGPMGYKKFARFLSSKKSMKPLTSLIRYVAGIEYEFEIRLSLKKEEIPKCVLGKGAAVPPLLGWTTWISGRDVQYDRDQHITFQESVFGAR